MAGGVSDNRIHFVGNTMVDTLLENIDRLRQPDFWKARQLDEKNYYL
jgi:UDP-N-acetylglucosamine 2-epimerase (non-hydrolysing)